MKINKKYKIIDPKDLPKRYEFKDKEKFWRDIWEDKGIYKRLKGKSRSASFVIDSPPPTVSGSLHVGHIFSYTHQDIIARYKRMQNFNVIYPMGWDDNGLPTERRVQNIFGVRIDNDIPYIKDLDIYKRKKELGLTNDDSLIINRQNFIEMCHKVTEKDEIVFKDLFRRMGYSIDWQDEYATIDNKSRYIAQSSFVDLFNKKHVYQSNAPTMWDVDFQTAVAQAEIEDREIQGAYHDLRFGIEDSKQDIIISTTRPELLAACVGITAHPDDKRYQDLFGKKAISPVFFAPIPIFSSELVDKEKGTGILMVCTFGDQTDVIWWRENDLPLRQIFSSDGKILDINFSDDEEKNIWVSLNQKLANINARKIFDKNLNEAKKIIIDLLKDPNNSSTGKIPLISDPKKILHPVRFYEKGESPIEYLSTRQWFVQILDKKEKLLEMGEKINWHPDYMSKRFSNWTENLSLDWCISRQRFFGVPIPVWYRLDENKTIDFDNVILPNIKDLPIDPVIDTPPGFTENQRNKPKGFIGEQDVFDTWFTSSMSPQIVSNWGIKNEEEMDKLFPMDIRPQSHEIIRTWAFYTIVKSLLHHNSIPWKNVVISGWILDPDRKKMSKSRGNVITPIDTIEQFGSDAVRYWAGSARLGTDTTYDESVFLIGNKLVTKLYNAAKFVLSHDSSETNDIKELDASFLQDLQKLINDVTNCYDKFEFAQALQLSEEFFWNIYTDNYIELVKKRVFNSEGEEKKSAVTTLRIALSVLLRIYAPVLPSITEEIWSWCFAKETNTNSIHQSNWPNVLEFKKFNPPENKDSLDVAIKTIRAIRKTKTANAIGLGKPVDSIKLIINTHQKDILTKIMDDVSNAAGCYNFSFELSDSEEIEAIISEKNV
mgnify:FL=1